MSDFNREVRYYVIKIKNLTEAQNAALCDLLSGAQIPCTDCVVVESDWPNYEHTWKTVAQVASGTFVDPYVEVETFRQQLAESQARVAELESQVWAVGADHCRAFILRKQAEAVEKCAEGLTDSRSQSWLMREASQLRNQADDAERAGGEK